MRVTVFAIWLTLLFTGLAEAKDWWNKDWTVRRKITIDASPKGGAINDPIGSAVVLVRLHDGNYQFPVARKMGMIFVLSAKTVKLCSHTIWKGMILC